MFRVYKIKPKVSERIKAVQVTSEKAAEIANALSGRLTTQPVKVDETQGYDQEGIQFPTLDGVKFCPMSDWIVRHDDATFEIVKHATFIETWEVARNTSGTQA